LFLDLNNGGGNMKKYLILFIVFLISACYETKPTYVTLKVLDVFDVKREYGTFTRKTEIKKIVIFENIETKEITQLVLEPYYNADWIFYFFNKNDKSKYYISVIKYKYSYNWGSIKIINKEEVDK
jgi:hypothetical protein